MACSFGHKDEFVPSISSIKILDRKDGSGFNVLLLEEPGEQGIACHGCKDLAVPMCVQYCPKSEDLLKFLDTFAHRKRSAMPGA